MIPVQRQLPPPRKTTSHDHFFELSLRFRASFFLSSFLSTHPHTAFHHHAYQSQGNPPVLEPNSCPRRCCSWSSSPGTNSHFLGGTWNRPVSIEWCSWKTMLYLTCASFFAFFELFFAVDSHRQGGKCYAWDAQHPLSGPFPRLFSTRAALTDWKKEGAVVHFCSCATWWSASSFPAFKMAQDHSLRDRWTNIYLSQGFFY